MVVTTNKLPDRSYFHCAIKKIFRHLKLPLKVEERNTQFTSILVMDQHLGEVLTCIYPTTLLRIPAHTQVLVPPTNLHLASAAPAPSWQEVTTSPLQKWKCFILCRTDLNISTVLMIIISQTNLKFSLVH